MAQGHGNPIEHVMDHPNLEILGATIPLPWVGIGNVGFQITRFMVMEVIAAVLVAAVMIPLTRHVARQRVTRGVFMNLVEAFLLFIRDGIARPAIGGHGADAFLPFLWTLFFFILFNNLLGMIPGGASPTGNINVTGVLALLTLGVVVLTGMRKMGPIGFWVGIVPHLDVPMVLKPFLWILMFVIEVAGLLIRHVVLAVRLFANMMAGHIVLAVILGFIVQAWNSYFIFLVAPASILGVVALSLLELFVAFLQAYIFTFLAALFIGSAVHPH
jgi:F-type H+-transporting ATPase subunit a